MIAKNSAGPVDTITFFAEAPSHVYDLARQTNQLLQKGIEIAREYVSEGENGMTLVLTFINIVEDSQIILKNVWQIGMVCLQPLLFISKRVVPRKSSARPLSEIARLQHFDIATKSSGRVPLSLPHLLSTR